MSPNPILVRLRGGLGNQMFQYAFGRALALRLERELWLDTALLAQPQATPRAYALAGFGLPARLATPVDARSISGLIVALRQAGRAFLPEARDFRPLPGPLVLDGYWQSEGYFSSSAEALRRDFSVGGATPAPPELGRAIASAEAVAVHVRRGDYLDRTRAQMTPLPAAYYEAAAARMAAGLRHPHFFVFSDDIDWCRAHLAWPGAHTLVSRSGAGGDDPMPEFRLMGACRHFIVANSTFSWWAAWLGRAAEKRVIAPARWFPDDPAGDRAIICPGWEAL